MAICRGRDINIDFDGMNVIGDKIASRNLAIFAFLLNLFFLHFDHLESCEAKSKGASLLI